MTAPNQTQAESWNGESGQRWAASAQQRDQVLAPVADSLLDRASPAPGGRVLDVGCGCGATSIAAGAAVGPDGSVTGIDLSTPMLDVARRRAADAGLDQVGFVEGDAQTHAFEPDEFSLILSRFGTMFFDDPVAAAANLCAATAPGGRLCIATWRPLAANDWLTVPGAVLLGYADPPEQPAGPGMFAQADPSVVAAHLEAAGYTGVTSERVDVAFALGRDPVEAAAYLAESGPGRAMLDTINDPAKRAAALAAVEAELAKHCGPAGVSLAGGIWVTTASKPR